LLFEMCLVVNVFHVSVSMFGLSIRASPAVPSM
jgi:hypothetical protein